MTDDLVTVMVQLQINAVPVRVQAENNVPYLSVDVEQAEVTVEQRPPYCDRGRYIVKVFPRGPLALSLDHQDAFPRYYFGAVACADEIAAWLRARDLL